jgi:sensor histidine kinase regulating citrate/malate metabolism
MSTTGEGDVSVKVKGKKIAFEIETGSNIEKKGEKELEKKFNSIKKNYDELYIVVTNWVLKRKYSEFGKAITRQHIAPLVDSWG